LKQPDVALFNTGDEPQDVGIKLCDLGGGGPVAVLPVSPLRSKRAE
jgi:hypothetical protein